MVSLYLDRIVGNAVSGYGATISSVPALASQEIFLKETLNFFFHRLNQPSEAMDFSTFNSFAE